MCEELICVPSFVLVLSAASSTLADLVAHWKMDEGAGGIVVGSKSFLKACEVCVDGW